MCFLIFDPCDFFFAKSHQTPLLCCKQGFPTVFSINMAIILIVDIWLFQCWKATPFIKEKCCKRCPSLSEWLSKKRIGLCENTTVVFQRCRQLYTFCTHWVEVGNSALRICSLVRKLTLFAYLSAALAISEFYEPNESTATEVIFLFFFMCLVFLCVCVLFEIKKETNKQITHINKTLDEGFLYTLLIFDSLGFIMMCLNLCVNM